MFREVSPVSHSNPKFGSHITVMVPAVPAEVSKAEYDYGTCVLPQAEFNLVCSTAGTVVREKQSRESLMKWSSS